MTETQYRVVAARIVFQYLKHRRFIYNANLDFDTFKLNLTVRYTGGRRFWIIKADKFKIDKWQITECAEPVFFDPTRLLQYLN